MALVDVIDGKLEKERKLAGFKGSVNVEEKEILVDPTKKRRVKNCSFYGVIDTKRDVINIGYKPSYEKRKPKKTLCTVVNIERHEINHKGDARTRFRGCPKTLRKHLDLYKIIRRVLRPLGFKMRDTQYVVNAFEDFIDDINIMSRFDCEGLARFYEDVGHCSNNEYSAFFEAFVKLQGIWMPKKYKRLLGKYYTHKPEIKKTLDNFLERSGLNSYKRMVDGQEIRDRAAMLSHMNREERWDDYARIFAEEFSKLMQPGYALPIPGLSGAGTKGQEEEKEGEEGAGGEDGDEESEEDKDGDEDGKGKGDEEDDQDDQDSDDDDFSDGDEEEDEQELDWDDLEGGNSFDQDMKDPDKRRDQAFDEYQKGNERPEYFSKFESLDGVYQKLARRLNIKAHTHVETTSMPITWYGKQEYDPQRHSPKRVKFGFNKERKIRLMKPKWHYDIPLEFKIQDHGLPEARFVLLDTSGSMQESPNGGSAGDDRYIPWGRNSKYHYALLAWYGFIEYLKRNHILKKTSMSLANFSGRTILGKGLEEAKRNALSPQWGNTYLDPQKVNEMFDSEKSMLIFTISDGDIFNWSSIKDQFIRKIIDNEHLYFHLQLGRRGYGGEDYDNDMCRDLKAAGIPVYYVTGENDLWQKVIEISDKVYKRPKKEKSHSFSK
jgi:hypothetical protein